MQLHHDPFLPSSSSTGIISERRSRSHSYSPDDTGGISSIHNTSNHEPQFTQTNRRSGQSSGEQTGETKEQNTSPPTDLEQKESSDGDGDSDNSINLCVQIPQFVNTIMKRKRKRLKNQKDVYAEAAKQIQLEKEASFESNVSESKAEAKRKGMRRLLDIAAGDVGLALFIPINWEAFEPLVEHECGIESNHSEESSEDELIIASDDEIEVCPSILSEDQMKYIQKTGLPPTVSLMTWNRMYSLQRDGDCFQTMFKKVSRHQHTMIIIKTVEGDILGGYADTPWAKQRSSGAKFFGGGRAFLFATNPLLGKEAEAALRNRHGYHPISFFRWTGINDYSQVCDLDAGSIGMGGGGAFGFYVQDNFTWGSSGSCDTFSNPPLVKSDGGSFNVLDLEVYVFTSMSSRIFNTSTRASSNASFNSSLSASTKSISSMF